MSTGAGNDSGTDDGATAARELLRLVRADEIDAAIEAGLAGFVGCEALSEAGNAELAAARDRLRVAWAARERYLARTARLARRADARKAARSTSTDAGTQPTPAPTLPAAAAAALARARARMAHKP